MDVVAASLVRTAAAAPARQIRVEAALNPFDFWPMILTGYREWAKSPDAEVDGERVEGALEIIYEGLRRGAFKLFLMLPMQGKEVSGFAVVTVRDGYFEDLLNWVRPDMRRQGVWRAYHQEINKLVSRLHLKGRVICSTLPVYNELAPSLGFHISGTIEQSGGPVVTRWLKEV